MERRRIEDFAKKVDTDRRHDHLHSQPSSSSEEELFDMVGVTEQLDHLGDQLSRSTTPDVDFQAKLRQRLMAVAAVQGIGATARHQASAPVAEPAYAPASENIEPEAPRRFRGGRRLAILAALLTGTVALSGVSTASGNAMPGDALYGVKRSTEKAQLALAGSDLSKAQLHFEFARTRMHEAAAVSDDSDAVVGALEDMNQEILDGVSLLGEVATSEGDPAALDFIDLFANEHRHGLVELIGALEGEPREVAGESLTMLEDASVRSVQLRSALSCTEAAGPSDRFGPLPGTCGTLPAGDAADIEDAISSGAGAHTGGSADQTGSSADQIEEPIPPSDAPDHPGTTVVEPSTESGSTSDPDASESEGTESADEDSEGDQGSSSGGLLDELGSTLNGLLGNKLVASQQDIISLVSQRLPVST
ncbi:DUF5667 domain-containing protein [Natronoglycomyces albus]|uniref:DUF5667 domain-containing protein n=1 Tax=Natronoglycomyces albus TaxID=2811108 RepID=A0A895XTL2_9ACTN|nr:DUF5667 domain-containing protein [Natronoglycomyces albus]QSB05590.1 hypothetical protein JQS30_01260 [Natronoglycomyces albus]